MACDWSLVERILASDWSTCYYLNIEQKLSLLISQLGKVEEEGEKFSEVLQMRLGCSLLQQIEQHPAMSLVNIIGILCSDWSISLEYCALIGQYQCFHSR